MSLMLLASIAGCGPGAQQAFSEKSAPLPARSFAVQWAEDVQPVDDPITALHVADDFVFAYTRGGTSHVLARDTGQLLHIDPPQDGRLRLHPPVVLKERIVYPTTTYLEVFDFNGRYISHPSHIGDDTSKPFSQQLKYPIRSDAVGNGKNLLFFGADYPGGGRVVAADMTSPYVPEVWTLLQPGAGISAAPAVLKDVVFVADEQGRVEAASIESRAQLWTLPNGVFSAYAGVTGNLFADATGLYVAATDSKLYCIKTNDGRIKWQYNSGAPLHRGPTVTTDTVYQYVPGAGIAALDKAESTDPQRPNYLRQPRWIVGSARQFLAQDEQNAYLRTSNNTILAVNKQTGQTEFESKRSDLAHFATNTKDAMIYCATSGGRVFAVKPVLHAGGVGQIVFAPLVPRAREQVVSAR